MPKNTFWFEAAVAMESEINYESQPMYYVHMAVAEQQKRTADAFERIATSLGNIAEKYLDARPISSVKRTPMTPDEFDKVMDKNWTSGADNAQIHIQADSDVVTLLKQLGYFDSALLFEAMAAELKKDQT